MDNFLRTKIQELEKTPSTSSTIQGLNYIGRMLHILDTLTDRNLDNMVEHVTMALIRQNSRLESTRLVGGNDAPIDLHHNQRTAEGPSSASEDTRKNLNITVCSSRSHKFYSTDGSLRLGWDEQRQLFHVFQGLQNLSTVISELRVAPDNIRTMYLSHRWAKILVESSDGTGHDLPFYLEASDKKTIFDLYSFIIEASNRRIQIHIMDRYGHSDLLNLYTLLILK